MGGLGRVLIVEDDDVLAGALEAFAKPRSSIVERAATKDEALRRLALAPADMILLDMALPDGSGHDVLAFAATQQAFPRVVVITGSTEPETAFQLAQAGVRFFVAKPLTLSKLERAWDRALLAPDIAPLIRASVGARKLHELESEVRRQMTDEALAVSHGSRHKASAVLGISRQLLQRILRTRS
jgi:DNA-binding NtrC family response regulator